MDVGEPAASGRDDVLGVIAAEPPDFDAHAVSALLARTYGIAGRLEPLVSERDQNFRVVTDAEGSFVLKIASAAEDPAVTDLQISALRHLERAKSGVGVPRIRKTLDGDDASRLAGDAGTHVVRLVTYLPGEPLADVGPDAAVARDIGRSLARLDEDLRTFEHAAGRRVLLWDIQQSLRLRGIVANVDDAEERGRVSRVLDDFESRVEPRLASVRRQVIHNDANPDNILVTGDPGAASRRVAGIIDFGDMVEAPLVNELAVAAAYLRAPPGDALRYVAPLVAGFDETTRLEREEISLLFDLVRARLATTICILWWRLAARGPEDAYRDAAIAKESGAGRFLAALERLGRDEFNERIGNCLRRGHELF